MKQRDRRIDDFFRCQDPQKQRQKQRQYSYFYIDWAVEPYVASWMCERPVPLDFQADIECKALGRIITVCCVFAPLGRVDEEETVTSPLYQDKTLVSLLKSNLQKCVRRQLVQRAKETARYLMDLDLQLLVRRLAIIMLEDVVLHQSFTTLVWLTAALSKHFLLAAAPSGAESTIKAWLLGLVDMLCRESRESYWSCGIDNTLRCDDGAVRAAWNDAGAVSSLQRDIIFALLLRQSYGGLPGDCAMMLSYAALVRQPDGASHISLAPVQAHPLSQVNRLDLNFIELCAVDFHCVPGMLFALAQHCQKNNKRGANGQTYTQQEIRAAVWHHNSKHNKRVVTQPQAERDRKRDSHTCYHAIKWKLEWLQQEHVKVCCNTVALQQYRLDSRGAATARAATAL